MSAHLQFGPEWMRKGRGKTSSAIGTANVNEGAVPSQEVVNSSAPTSIPTTASKSIGATSKRHPSLGNLSANSASSGSTSAPAPSPGAFSFAAAAAQAAATKESTQTSSTTSSSILQNSEGDSARYSKRLLSLYSSERGGKAPSQDTSSSATVLGNKVRYKVVSMFDVD
jgi:PERQ amino acid-rich with GYF domain-containing protein